MKKIEAIIRKTKFEEVKEALLTSDINWFEYHDVHGIGQSRQERIYSSWIPPSKYCLRWPIQVRSVTDVSL